MLDAARRLFFGAPITTETKAETGSGVYSLMNYPTISSLTDNPVNKIAEAQALFRQNPWVAQAERAIVGRYVAAGYHLEDSEGNTVGDDGPAVAVKSLLDTPSTEPKVTRRSLWRLTLRHEGLAGNGFWYLDQRLGGVGPPLQCLYINPARMTPVENDAGKLIGWVMDHPQNPISQRRNLRNPVPFELDELRHFVLDDPDWGHYGIGVAEAAYNQIMLDNLAVKHASGVFAAGGRLAGMVSPKANVTISDEQWLQLVRDWRTVTSDPDSAKRLLIARGPVDFNDTTANPAEMEMVDILKLSRDDIFTAWGVPLAQAPIATPGGLNSGFDKQFDEAALWQGAIDYRAAPFEEQVQSIIDLFGLNLRLVVEKPAFDDQAPLFENAEKATAQPLTNNERRALLGFDPLDDDEWGKAIFIASSMTRMDAEPNPTPPQLLPFTGGSSEEEATPESSGLGEASQPVKASLRENTARLWEPRLRRELQAFLIGQANAIANRVKNNHAHIVTRPTDTKGWWNEKQWNDALASILEPLLGKLADSVGRRVRPATQAKAGWVDNVVDFVKSQGAKRIVGINQTTRDSVARLIAEGVKQGMSPAELAQTIRDGAAFNEARADMIARTETALAYNEAALKTYDHFEVREVQAIDGDKDEECAARNGNTYSVDEAMGIVDHPNGTLDWIPIVAAKAQVAAQETNVATVPEIHLSVPLTVPAFPELPAAQVTVNVPKPDPVVVNLPEPQVTVNVPEQPAPQVTVEAAKATTPQEVIVTSMPERFHKVLRNKDGSVRGSLEVDD